LIVSGIWPPDVGGPATHAPELADFLHSHRHAVEIVTTASHAPEAKEYRIHWVSRSMPTALRHLRVAALVRARASKADVVYTTGMFARSAAGAVAGGAPYVVKLTGDPAFERARWRGLVDGDVESFQSAGGTSTAALKALRDATLGRAAWVFCPSDYLRRLAIEWGVPRERVSVLPNAAPTIRALPARDELRKRLGFEGPTFVFAGRLTPQKSLGTALEALARVDGVELVIAGDGPETPHLERRARELGVDGRARFLGPRPRARVLELFAAADAALLPSTWENFPHAVVEALAVGTPAVASDVGGVGEIVRDGENGLLVEPADAEALARAFERIRDDPALVARLREAAAPSVSAFAPERLLARVEATLAEVAR
jgi:glycosyltransferase involved in cell wall biosynthesis